MLAGMPCKTCAAANDLVVCLFCGHPFCGSHRSERDGAAACTACQEAEHARSSARSRTVAAQAAVARKAVDAPSASQATVGAPDRAVVEVKTGKPASGMNRFVKVLVILFVGSIVTAALTDFTPTAGVDGAQSASRVISLLLTLIFAFASIFTGGQVAPEPAAMKRSVPSPHPIGTPVSAGDDGGVALTLKPLEPIREAGWTPVLAGLGVGAVTGVYLWFFLAWLFTGADGVPVWARPTGTGLGAAFAFAGVWIITKSRSS